MSDRDTDRDEPCECELGYVTGMLTVVNGVDVSLDMSGSVVLSQLESVLMVMTCVVTEDHIVGQDLDHILCLLVSKDHTAAGAPLI